MTGERTNWSRVGGWCAAILLLAATLAVAGWHVRQLQFFCDDSYISYRYSQNFAAGRGLVYNAGEYVEGYTNFLWVALVAIGMKLGGGAEPVSLGLGIFFLLVTLVATFLLARRLFRSEAFAAVPCFLLVCQGPMILWSVSGLEASCFAAFTMLALLAYERGRHDSWKRMLLAGALYAVSTMVRPDGVVFGGAAGLHLALTAPFLRPFTLRALGRLLVRAGALAGGFVALLGPFVLWRHQYYGDWLPNTFYVKAGGLVNVTLGLGYLRTWFLEYWVVGAPAVVGIVVTLVAPRFREQRGTFAHVALALALFGGYLVWAGGDYMALYRFMVPLLPLAMIPCTALLVVLYEALRRARVPALAGATAGFALLAVAGWALWLPTRGSLDGVKRSPAISTVKGMKENSAQWVALGKAIKQKMPANFTLATTAAGALPFFAELRTIDQSGLCDRHTAKVESDPWWLDRPGHMKQATRSWIAQCRPELVFWHPLLDAAPSKRLFQGPPTDDYELRAMDVESLPGADHVAYFWVRKDVVAALAPRGVVAARESGRFARASDAAADESADAPDGGDKPAKAPTRREKLAEEIASDLRALAAAAPTAPANVDPPLPPPYAGPVFVTRHVQAADPAGDELRLSVGDVSRPLWTMDAAAELDVSGVAGSYVEIAIASAPVLDAASVVVKQLPGQRVPKVVALALVQSGRRHELQSKMSVPPFAGARSWRIVRADLSGIAPGRYALDVNVDGSPVGKGSGWLVSVPRHCQETERDARPNVLIITIDTLRADYLSCYGHDRPTSPQIDQLAAKGVLFERNVSQAPWTLPSYSSAFSGLYVESHGVVHRDHKFQQRFVTFLEKLAQAGYATGGIASGTFTDAFWGFDQGFDDYDDLGMVVDESKANKAQAADGHAPTDREAMQNASHRRVTSPEVANKAIAWLDAHRDRRFALFVHFFDPHEDYLHHPGVSDKFPPRPAPRDFPNQVDPKPEVTATMRALYEGEIAYTDLHVGRVLARLRELGLEEETIVAVFADHGESFKEHVLDPEKDFRNRGHGSSLFDEQVHVPLILRVPGVKPSRVAAPVGNVDLGPTLLDYCAVDATGWLPNDVPHGLSLRPLLEDPSAQREAPVLTAHYVMVPRDNLPAGADPAEDRVQIVHRLDKDAHVAIEYEPNGGQEGMRFLFERRDRWQDYANNLATKMATTLEVFRRYYAQARPALEALVKPADTVDTTGVDDALRKAGYAVK